MKKLLSLVLCAVLLCSVAVFPASAEDETTVKDYEGKLPVADNEDEMTVEEYEKAFFGEHYITDAEAAAFALAGYPGASIPDSESISKYDVVFNLGEAAEEKLSLLEEYFPKQNYFYYETDDGRISVYFVHVGFPMIDPVENLPEKKIDCDLLMLNIKILYALTQLAGECDGSTVELVYYRNPGDYGRSLHADVNGDLKVNAKDILAIKRFIVGIDYRIALCNTDPTKDNQINAKDILQIKRYIVGIDDYTDRIIYPGPDGIYYNPIKGHFDP